MHPPSKTFVSVIPLFVGLVQETAVVAELPVLVFIQVGVVHGLAQKRMLPFTCCAAFTYGMRYIMSRLIEKLDREVSPDVSSSV